MNNDFIKLTKKEQLRIVKFNQNFEYLYELYNDTNIDEDIKNEIEKNKIFTKDKILFLEAISSKDFNDFEKYKDYTDDFILNALSKHKNCPSDLKVKIFSKIKTIDEQIALLNFFSDDNVRIIASNTIHSNVIDFIIDNPKFNNEIKDIAKQSVYYKNKVISNSIQDFINKSNKIDKLDTLINESKINNFEKNIKKDNNENDEFDLENSFIDLDIDTKSIIKHLTLTSNISDLIKYYNNKNIDIKLAIANNPNTPLNILEKMSLDPNYSVKLAIAFNPNVSFNILEDFINIDNETFLSSLLASPQLSKPLIRKIYNKSSSYVKSLAIQILN